MAEEQQAGFKVGDKVYPFPDSEFTLAEAGAVEEISGQSIYDFSEALEEASVTKTPPPLRVLSALMYVAMRRDDPRLTVKRFLQQGALSWEMVAGENEDDEGEGEDEVADPPEPPEKHSPGASGPSGVTSGGSAIESSEPSTTGETASLEVVA